MSASGLTGFYKFRCKYFLTYNCENWVWVNHSACAECVATGRDSVDNESLHDDNSGSGVPSPVVPSSEIISPRRRIAAAAMGFNLLFFCAEEEHMATAMAVLSSREFQEIDGNNDGPGSWETAVKVHPCCNH